MVMPVTHVLDAVGHPASVIAAKERSQAAWVFVIANLGSTRRYARVVRAASIAPIGARRVGTSTDSCISRRAG
jgi:hypothetical protein